MRARGLSVVVAICGVLSWTGCNRAADDAVAVRVRGLRTDAASNLVVILEEESGERTLPIWIGLAEARSIASVMEKIQPSRPNTHDLAGRLLDGLGARVERVIVTDLRENIYFAVLVVRRGGERVEIDSRPSDAIAIALRLQAPIFVRTALFEDLERDTLLDESGERVPL